MEETAKEQKKIYAKVIQKNKLRKIPQ